MLHFLILFFSVWLLFHGYLYWCLSGLPWLRSRGARWGLALAFVALFAAYPLSRWAFGTQKELLGQTLETLRASWIGVVLLLLVSMLAADVLALLCYPFCKRLLPLRRWALLVALVLSVVAWIQGHRDPAIEQVELTLPHLPKDQDGLKVVLMTDLHLGTQFESEWLRRQAVRVAAEHPQAILLSGDVVDNDATRVETMREAMATLKAPLGVWVVLGNHDVYARPDPCERLFTEVGYHVLRNRAERLPNGVWIAGVDDLVASRQDPLQQVEAALKTVSRGAPCIYLSHTPVLAEAAAERGAGLMLCGHTHGGQIWPFSYAVQARFPLFKGAYAVQGMGVYVSRGAGSWGPRMRLWEPGQIVVLTLRAR